MPETIDDLVKKRDYLKRRLAAKTRNDQSAFFEAVRRAELKDEIKRLEEALHS